ncbi:MAG: hypothetical protein B7C24_12350 [Bacteroidetes bacterium 4572_77]|nr:MAG: hypothetical protein B7C24_12350 [Bacteroidetes bacterium 4572_77]
MGIAQLYYKLPMPVKRFCSRMKLFKLYNLGVINRYKIAHVDGVKFNVDLYTYVGCSLYRLGIYETQTAQVIEDFVKLGDTVIDIGSSIGAHALRLAKKVGPEGKVFTFEPSIFLYKEFLENIKLNKFNNIHSENMGLSDKNEIKSIRMERLGRLDRGKKHHPIMVIEVRESTVSEIHNILSKLGYKFYNEGNREEINKDGILLKAVHVDNILCRWKNDKKKVS